ncbi:hypothetical protein [Solidesulfovibrio sp.]|nr:hypothetical protein [Solidesulfovibrio sp.]MEA4857916.1 hypothetical protein [Solidesulfovibrio sp.]
MDDAYLGTGEGRRSETNNDYSGGYGWGHYSAQNRETAEWYREELSREKASPQARDLKNALQEVDYLGFDTASQAATAIDKHPDWAKRWDVLPEEKSRIEAALRNFNEAKKGQLYQLAIPDPDKLLDWHKPLNEQPESVKEKLKQASLYQENAYPTIERSDSGKTWWVKGPGGWEPAGAPRFRSLEKAQQWLRENRETFAFKPTGELLYRKLATSKGGQKAASQYLDSIGIPGHQYLDAGSRGASKGTHNVVTYSDRHIDITGRFRRRQAPGVAGFGDVATVRQALAPGLEQYPAVARLVDVFATEGDMPPALRRSIEAAGMSRRFYAVYDPESGRIAFVAANIPSARAAQAGFLKMLLHHEGRHAGLSFVFGSEAAKLDWMGRAAATLPREVAAWLRKHKRPDTAANRAEAAEEILVDWAAAGKVHNWVDRLLARIAAWIRKFFPKLRLTRAEMRDLLARVDDWLTGKGPRFVGEREASRGSREVAPAFSREETRGLPERVRIVALPSERFPARHIAELRKEARKWALKHLPGSYRNDHTGWDIEITRRRIDKQTSQRENPLHYETLRVLPQIIKEAVLAESAPDRSNDPYIKAVHRLYAPLRAEGEIYRVKLTVKEYTDGRKLYDHSLTEMEKPARPVRDMPDGQRIDEPATGSPAPGHEGQDDISVRQLLDGVKGGDIRMARAEPQRLYGVTDGKVRALAEADGEGVTVHFAEGDSLREGAYRTEAFPDMAAARKAMADAGLTIMRQAVSGRAERQPGRARESGQGGGSFGSVPPATAPAQEKASQGAGGGNGATEGGKAAADEGPQALRLEMPELVRLARGLLGRYPAVLEKLYGRRLGSFHPRQGQSQIKLKADIFIGPKLAEAEFKTPAEAEAFVHEVLQKHGLAWDDAHVVTAKTPKGQAVSVYRVDPDYAAMVLAHEIGHLIDYLPDHELRRGNILGHVAGLKKYLKHWLANRPGGEGPLTPKDRLRLMSVARRMTAGRQYEIQVEEEIVKTLGVTPEDILGIWNDVAGRDKVSPKLYDYIAGLSSAEKKSILREAMRGLVAKELERFGRTVREKTGRMLTKIVAEPTRDAAVQAKYRDLVREEIEKRRLFSRDDLKEELKTLSRWWSPFDPAADAQYTAYRYGNEELYADALSALLNSPYEVKARAPGFYEAFFNWLGEKPEVKALYDAIQEDIRSGEYKTDRVKRLHQMFRKADEAYREKYEKKLEYGRPIKAALVNRHAPVFAALTDKRVRFLVEKAVYTGSQREGYLREVFTKVTKVLEKAGLELEDFGEYLFHKRVQGERSKMANPQGWTAKASGERLEEMRDASFTPDQARKLEKARKDFLAIRREWVIAEMEKADMFAPELMKAISEAEDYATFDVFSHSLEEGYGRGVGAAIHRQIGTVNEITNPFTATVMKDLSVLAAVNWNTAKRGVLEDLLAGKPGRIEPAKRVWNGKRLAPVEPKAADQGMVVYLDRGELKAFYVDRMVADAFDQQTAEEVSALGRLLQHVANPFRLVFTQFNPGFQMYNVIKDFRSALINLPGANPEVRFLREYVKALVPAFQSAFGLPPETVKEMEKAGMFVSVANPMGVEREDVQMRRLEQMYGLRPKEWELHVWRPMDALFNWVAHGAMRAANFAFNLSGALERVPKIAGYTYLKRYFPGRSEYELAHMVRSWAGSPAFLNKGTAHAITNNLILFSNAFVQGNVASLEAMRANPKQYWWKWAKWSLVPKLLMWGAALGAFGEAMRQVMDGVGEYDKTNYLIIPLGQTQNKKSVVLRLPLDEFSRLTGGILWKTLQFVRTGDADGLNSLADFMAGQVPSLNPAFSVGTNVWSYLSGHNPYDMFRQRPIMDETTFRAGGTAAAKAMGKYVWNTVGGGVVYVFRNDDAIDVKKELFEQVVQAPFLANTLGRFVKVTDLGVREQLTAAKGEPQQSRARTILAVRSAMARLVNGDPLTQEELGLLAQERDYLRRNMPQALMRREGSALWDALMRAATKEEKIAILRKWQEMGRAANDR